MRKIAVGRVIVKNEHIQLLRCSFKLKDAWTLGTVEIRVYKSFKDPKFKNGQQSLPYFTIIGLPEHNLKNLSSLADALL